MTRTCPRCGVELRVEYGIEAPAELEGSTNTEHTDARCADRLAAKLKAAREALERDQDVRHGVTAMLATENSTLRARADRLAARLKEVERLARDVVTAFKPIGEVTGAALYVGVTGIEVERRIYALDAATKGGGQ